MQTNKEQPKYKMIDPLPDEYELVFPDGILTRRLMTEAEAIKWAKAYACNDIQGVCECGQLRNMVG